MTLSAGSRVGPYQILAPIGSGGMGEVYRAHDERLGRDVALKILSTELAASAEHLRRFEQEARAASGLNHPNIVTIHDIGRFESMAYIAMEVVDGRDLRSMLGGERLMLKLILRIVVKIADGLAAAHERGIVHRDLKPENVMVSRDGFVKILDFGLAKLVRPFMETDSTIPQTVPGAVFGTVGYMSPEQASGKETDHRSDQFALGVMLYEMLTQRLPFSAPTAAETLAAIIRTDPPPISNYNDGAPPELMRIVARCLSKDREDRYASTRDLARDLREVRDRISSPSQPRHKSDRPAEARRSRAAVIAAASFAVLAAIVTATVLMVRHPQPAKLAEPARIVAVLPFVDRSQTPDGQGFTDGLTDIIGTRLVQSRVRVIPMPDARGATAKDAAAAARSRGASRAIRGSVQRLNGELRVNFSVIDTTSGEQVAGDAITVRSGDLFTVEERIVERILATLNMRPLPRQGRSVPVELTAASDQNAYVEVLGLLQRAQDENSIDRAITTLQRLLQNARDSALVNAQLARALLYKAQLTRRPGLIAQASVYAERAAEIDDSLPEAHVRLGQVRSAAGRYAEAEQEHRRALELQGDNADAYLGLAETSEAMGRAADAEAMYKKAISLRPDHANTYNRYAAFLFNAGRPADAAANFLRFTQLLPTARGFSNLGAVYENLGRYDEAHRALERSIALEPTSDAYVNLGTVFYHTARYGEACRAYERATSLAPGSHVAWVGLGDAYRWSGDSRQKSRAAYQSAINAARAAVSVNPRDAVAHASEAIALAKLGRPSEAAAASNTALKLDPNNQSVLYAAGVVALLRGNPDVAAGWLHRAVSAGYSVNDLQRDPEFKPMHDDPAFPRPAVQHKT